VCVRECARWGEPELHGADELYNYKKALQQLQTTAAAVYEVGRHALRASGRPEAVLAVPTLDPNEVGAQRAWAGQTRPDGQTCMVCVCRAGGGHRRWWSRAGRHRPSRGL
jgi:hypothetical protein